jgi:hypothetical protein
VSQDDLADPLIGASSISAEPEGRPHPLRAENVCGDWFAESNPHLTSIGS